MRKYLLSENDKLPPEEQEELDRLNIDVNAFLKMAHTEGHRIYMHGIRKCGKEPSGWFVKEKVKLEYEYCSKKVMLEAITAYYGYVKKNYQSTCKDIKSQHIKKLCTHFWAEFLAKGDREITVLEYKLKKLEHQVKNIKEHTMRYQSLFTELALTNTKDMYNAIVSMVGGTYTGNKANQPPVKVGEIEQAAKTKNIEIFVGAFTKALEYINSLYRISKAHNDAQTLQFIKTAVEWLDTKAIPMWTQAFHGEGKDTMGDLIKKVKMAINLLRNIGGPKTPTPPGAVEESKEKKHYKSLIK
jgi:hypothetical protein